MAKSAKYWDRRAIRRLTEAEQQSEAYIRRIQRIYDRANRNIQRDIEAVYASYSRTTGLDVQTLKELLTASETEALWAEMQRRGLDGYVRGNYKARISRLEKIQAQIYARAKEVYPEEVLQHTMCYEGVINRSFYRTIYDMQMGTGLDFAFSKIDDNLVKALMREAWSGKNYSARIWGNTDLLAESVAEIVGGALISGQSIEKTSRQIRERFGVAKYYADRLVRTEANHFHNEADAMAYEEMDVEKYVFVATLDTRTSKKCQEWDGKAIPLKERQAGYNYPPLHPNCRSKTRAYMGAEVEATLQRRARNPVTGKNEIVGNVSYEEWAKQHGIGADNNKKPLKKATAQDIIGNDGDTPILTMEQTIERAKRMVQSDKYKGVTTMQEVRSVTKSILGYDGLPRVVSAGEFGELASDNTVLYRGVHASETKTATEIVDGFKNGALWTGNTGGGAYGNGIYFTPHASVAHGQYAGAGGEVIEIVLDKKAKVADFRTICSEFWETGIHKIIGLPTEDYQYVIRDVAQYAAVKGYDAVALNGWQGQDHVIVLNRTMCIVKGR
ncbi:MAG: minor capsid protein [Bacteroidaceae bacterium]|nr:minor capsid protein [Bacteroidaceae bacterium]